MKYFAILRDSFREALDTKILYVAFALSGLIVLFIAGIDIRQITMKEELDKRASMLEFLLKHQGRMQDLECRVEDFRQSNDTEVPWEGDYEFTFVLRIPLIGVAKGIDPRMGQALSDFVRGLFIHLHFTELKQEQGGLNEIRLKAVTKGTDVTRKEHWNHEPALFFGALPAPWLISSPAQMVLFIENNLVNAMAGWVIVLLGIVATSSFLPNLMSKGSVDLVLSKPVGRSRLLLFKYLGGLTFLFLNAAFIIVTVWLCVGLRSGIWSPAFLTTILLLTYFFAILYAVSTLAAVLTRSSTVCILVTCAAWFLLWLVGLFYGLTHPDPILPETTAAWMEKGRGTPNESSGLELPKWAGTTIDTLYKGLPRTRDLGRLTKDYLSRELLSVEARKAEGMVIPGQPNWAECLGVSTVWIVGLLALSCRIFARRDY